MKNSLYIERRKAGLSRRQLSELVNCHEQTIVKHEQPNHELTREWREKYASALNLPPERLLPEDVLQKVDSNIQEVPIISWVSAGRPMESLEQLPDNYETVAVQSDRPGLYAVHVSGDSMNRVAPDGSIVICDPYDKNLVNGRRYMILIGNEMTFKKYMSEGGPVRFEPESYNPGFAVFYADKPFSIIARVITVQIDI